MIRCHPDVWKQFLETPVVTLTLYGVQLRHVNAIETKFGLYLGSLQTVGHDQLCSIPNLSKVALISIREAMLKLLGDLEKEFYESGQFEEVSSSEVYD